VQGAFITGRPSQLTLAVSPLVGSAAIVYIHHHLLLLLSLKADTRFTEDRRLNLALHMEHVDHSDCKIGLSQRRNDHQGATVDTSICADRYRAFKNFVNLSNQFLTSYENKKSRLLLIQSYPESLSCA